jgi:hypothetical protein
VEPLEKVTQRLNSMDAGNESEGVCKGQSSRLDARVTGRVLLKRTRCLLAVYISPILATWTGEALRLGERGAVTR